MKVKINVTQRDIDRGEYDSCLNCPNAIAIRRHLKSKYRNELKVYKHYVETNSATLADMPAIAHDWISSYDQEEKVRPFTYALDIPARYLRAGKRPQ